MEKLIEELEALRDEAFHKSKYGDSYYAGKYVAYHKALGLVKKYVKRDEEVIECSDCRRNT